MSESPYVIRNYQPSDFNNFVFLYQEAEKLEPGKRPITPHAITQFLGRPNYSPSQDLFLVENYGKLIGYMDLTPELGISRIIINAWIHPEHRRRGLSNQLLNYALKRAGETKTSVLHVNIRENNTTAQNALSKLGFIPIRRFLELELDISQLNLTEANIAIQKCCYLKQGEEEILNHIQNRCFYGSWGYNPNTLSTITYYRNLQHFFSQDIILAHETNKVAGYCWTQITGDEEGRIFMLGVDPDCRGQGIGRRLLMAGLAQLKNKGAQVTMLTVDSENKEACALYESVGFQLQRNTFWYEKAVTHGTDTS